LVLKLQVDHNSHWTSKPLYLRPQYSFETSRARRSVMQPFIPAFYLRKKQYLNHTTEKT